MLSPSFISCNLCSINDLSLNSYIFFRVIEEEENMELTLNKSEIIKFLVSLYSSNKNASLSLAIPSLGI